MNAGSAGVSPATERSAPGWRSRGYLPHFDQPGLVQMITFRLADALPARKLYELHQELGSSQNPKWRKRLEDLMDAGHGACHLRDPSIAEIVEGAFLHFDGMRYNLLAWVVMPNHVHVLIEVLPEFSLSRIVNSWKGFTSKEANRFRGCSGRFWQPEYFDRMIRDERHLASATEYIHANPVKAGLASTTLGWPFSSARWWNQATRAGETPALPGAAAASLRGNP